jgi:hypothetical protein
LSFFERIIYSFYTSENFSVKTLNFAYMSWTYHYILLLYNKQMADKRGFYILYLILLKNEPPIGQKTIQGDFMFLSTFVKKWAEKIAKFWNLKSKV